MTLKTDQATSETENNDQENKHTELNKTAEDKKTQPVKTNEAERGDVATVTKVKTGEKAEKSIQPAETISSAEILKQLEEEEKVIEEGINAFWKAAGALEKIRDLKLYKREHKTFADYVEKRWKWSESYAYRLIAAKAVYDNILQDKKISEYTDKLPNTHSLYYRLRDLEPNEYKEAFLKLLESDK
jgi:hypothetical protein